MSSPETHVVTINGTMIAVSTGTTVAAAMLNAGLTGFTSSVSGEARGPICGMGICYGCTAVIDDVETDRTCQILCRDGMQIRTKS